MAETAVKAVLQMISPATGIVISDEIGLMGVFENETRLTLYDDSVADIRADRSIANRGDYYRVLDKDGCILFDEKVKSTGIMIENGEIVGYIFELLDYSATQTLDLFFDDDCKCRPIIIYYKGSLYVNNIDDEKIKNKYKYDENIWIEPIDNTSWSLEFKKKVYYSILENAPNGISVYRYRG